MISRLHLRHWLFVGFTLISIIPVLFLALWIKKPVLEREIIKANEKHLLIATSIAHSLERYAIDVTAIFRFVVTNKSADISGLDLAPLLNHIHLQKVFLSDSEGYISKEYSLNKADKLSSPLPESLLSQFHAALLSNTALINDVVFTGVLPGHDAEPTLYLVMPLSQGRLAIGVLSTTYFKELQQSISFGIRGHAAIFDHQGKVIAHPRQDWVDHMKNLTTLEPVTQMLAGHRGVTIFDSPAINQPVVAGYTTVPKLGWGVMIPQPMSELQRSAADLAKITFEIVLLGLLGAGILSWWLAGFLSQPVLAITQATRKLSAGQSIIPIRSAPTTPIELHGLIESFNSMVDKIVTTSHALEEKTTLLQTTLDNVSEGITLIDKKGHLILCNRRFTEFFQLPAELALSASLSATKPFIDKTSPDNSNHLSAVLDAQGQRRLKKLLYDNVDVFKHQVEPDGRVIERHRNALPHDGWVMSYIDVTERERLEETLRTLHTISTSQTLCFLDRVKALLETGSRQFNLPMGILSHVQEERYHIIQAISPDQSLIAGMKMALGNTYCRETLQSKDPIGFENASESTWRTHPCFEAFKLEAYLGIPVIAGGLLYGTLNFSSLTPHPVHFSSTDKELIKLMAQWVGSEISRQQAEQALFEEKERAQVTLKSIGDAVITTTADGNVDYLNPMAERLTGWLLKEAKGHSLEKIFPLLAEKQKENLGDPVLDTHPAAIKSQTQVLIHRNGQRQIIEASYSAISDKTGELLGQVVVFRDVTEARQLAQQMVHQATHDALTGLVNRREFERRLERVLETAQTDGVEHALCYVDLDQFKVINDTCGHIAGDALLRQLGTLLPTKIRKRDTLARLGGDEFGVLMEHCSLNQARRVANAILRTLEDYRFIWNGNSFSIGASIGLVPITVGSNSITFLLSAADSACYAAKERGRHRISVYHEGDEELAKRQGEMQWAARLPRALETNRFRLYYQPIVALNGAHTQGHHYELLLRMEGEDGQLVLPGAFLPAAERYGFSTKLDRWVIRLALNWLQEHSQQLDQLTLCSINLSGHSLGDDAFLEDLVTSVKQTEIPAQKICFEITETAAITNLSNATRFIKTLKSRGCQFALDDFGSGLSSFAYLKNLPVDFLKIDGLFVKDIARDPLDLALVKSINDIGHVMGKKTIAEFVENKAVLEKIQAIGVDYGQGFGIGRPRPIEDML
jgi:diguanylate cyclase (GGDEF)-like protein/PAS domain S-box-containing protein